MGHRNTFCTAALLSLLTLGLAAQTPGDSSPSVENQGNANIIKVAVHSSRWDYPKEVTPGPGQKVHVVAKGDTLWDLGTKYLGNPFAWPQIWELNKWIQDPHWIYPGDPILVDASRGTVAAEEQTPPEVANLKPDIRLVPKPINEEYAYTFQDFIQMPFLVPGTAEAYMKQVGAFKIVGKQDTTKTMVADGDVLYLDGGSDQGLKPGDRLVVTTIAARKFYHPDDRNHRAVLGDVLEQSGVLRIVRVNPANSVGIVEHAMDGILVGAYAAPFVEPTVLREALRKDTSNPVHYQDPVSKIIYIRNNKTVASGGDMLILDHGTADGYKIGDVLLTARSTPIDTAIPKSAGGEVSHNYLGQVVVIGAMEHSATGRILRSNAELQVGDTLTH